MQTRQLYASVTASSQIYFDMPQSARIKGIQFTAFPSTVGASGDYLELEVSLISVNQTAVNDAVGIVAVASFGVTGAGSPASTAANGFSYYAPADASVKAGDRVYLTYTESGTSTWRVRALVYYS